MSATIRAVTSAGPPAAKGTIIVTALAGYSSATAPVIAATISRTTAAHCLVMMVSPTSFVDPRQPISVRTFAAASHIAFNLPNATPERVRRSWSGSESEDGPDLVRAFPTRALSTLSRCAEAQARPDGSKQHGQCQQGQTCTPPDALARPSAHFAHHELLALAHLAV